MSAANAGLSVPGHALDGPRGPAVSLRERLSRNGFASVLATTVALGVSFGVLPVVVHGLGAEQYGVWGLVGQIGGYAGLFDLGLGLSLTREIAAHRAKGTERQLGTVVSTVFFSYVGIGIAVSLLYLGAIFWFLPAFQIPTYLLPSARVIGVLASATALISFPGATYSAMLAGHQRQDVLYGISVFRSLLLAGLSIWVVTSGHGLIAYGMVSLVVTAAGIGISAYLVHRLGLGVKIAPRAFHWRYLRQTSSYSAELVLLNVCNQVVWYTDNLVVGAFLPVSLIAYYVIAVKLTKTLQTSVAQIFNVLFPAFVHLDAAEDMERKGRLLRQSTTLAAGIAWGGCMALAAASAPLLRLWTGEGVAISAAVVYGLLPGILGDLVGAPAATMLMATGRLRFALLVAVADACLNLGLSLALVQPLGPVGVAIGTSIPHFLAMVLFVLPFAAYRVGGMDGWMLVVHALRPGGVAVVVGLPLWLLMNRGEPGPGELAALAVLGGATYLVGFTFTCLSAEERDVWFARVLSSHVARRLQLT